MPHADNARVTAYLTHLSAYVNLQFLGHCDASCERARVKELWAELNAEEREAVHRLLNTSEQPLREQPARPALRLVRGGKDT